MTMMTFKYKVRVWADHRSSERCLVKRTEAGSRSRSAPDGKLYGLDFKLAADSDIIKRGPAYKTKTGQTQSHRHEEIIVTW